MDLGITLEFHRISVASMWIWGGSSNFTPTSPEFYGSGVDLHGSVADTGQHAGWSHCLAHRGQHVSPACWVEPQRGAWGQAMLAVAITQCVGASIIMVAGLTSMLAGAAGATTRRVGAMKIYF